MRVLRRASADPATVNALGGQRLEAVRLQSESISRLLGGQRKIAKETGRSRHALASLEVESVSGSKIHAILRSSNAPGGAKTLQLYPRRVHKLQAGELCVCSSPCVLQFRTRDCRLGVRNQLPIHTDQAHA